MENFKKNFKKYFILLAGFYLGIRIIVSILFVIYPNILTFEISQNSTRSFSEDYLVALFTYLTNIVFVISINNDFKKVNVKSLPILIVTFLSNTIGVIFSMILLFAVDLNKNRIDYETTN
jgi:uncharacterized protein YacL